MKVVKIATFGKWKKYKNFDHQFFYFRCCQQSASAGSGFSSKHSNNMYTVQQCWARVLEMLLRLRLCAFFKRCGVLHLSPGFSKKYSRILAFASSPIASVLFPIIFTPWFTSRYYRAPFSASTEKQNYLSEWCPNRPQENAWLRQLEKSLTQTINVEMAGIGGIGDG